MDELEEGLAGIGADKVAGTDRELRRKVPVAEVGCIGGTEEKADRDVGICAVRQPFLAQKLAAFRIVYLIRIVVRTLSVGEHLRELPVVSHIEAARSAQGRCLRPGLADRSEVLGEVCKRTREMAGIACALEDGIRECQIFLVVALGTEELGEVEPCSAVHRVPAYALLQRLDGFLGIPHPHAGKRKVGIEPRERLSHILERARILLDTAVGQALEERRKGEPLHILCRLAVRIDVFLGVLGKCRQTLLCCLILPVDHERFCRDELILKIASSHIVPVMRAEALLLPSVLYLCVPTRLGPS